MNIWINLLLDWRLNLCWHIHFDLHFENKEYPDVLEADYIINFPSINKL